MAPFSRSIVELGGLERVYLLTMIAKFDVNRDGGISRSEFETARVAGEKCVSNAVTGCANFAIISALLFSGAHALTIGRPKPFEPDADSVDAFGEEVTTVVIWCAYGLNVLAQSLALGIIITSNPNPDPNPKPSPNSNPNPNQASSSRPSSCGSYSATRCRA